MSLKSHPQTNGSRTVFFLALGLHFSTQVSLMTPHPLPIYPDSCLSSSRFHNSTPGFLLVTVTVAKASSVAFVRIGASNLALACSLFDIIGMADTSVSWTVAFPGLSLEPDTEPTLARSGALRRK